jgi:hypothetical protein
MPNTEEMRAEGYRPGMPNWGLIDGGSIDAEVCAGSDCSECGHKGMQYRPFVNREEKSHRAFAVCPECGYEEEF